jgi:hypothetical protein
VAVQRFGEGRAMVFAGEASWRWRMMLPATDRVYDMFWRQATRWLSLPAADPITVSVRPGVSPGEAAPVRIIVRNAAFEPRRDVTVDVRIASPGGRLDSIVAAPESAAEGRYAATFTPAQAGVFKISAEAKRGSTVLGTASTSVLVGGADLEMTEPRLNLPLLQRLAAASGGRMLSDDQLGGLADVLRAAGPSDAVSRPRDLWHTGWSFAAILTLLAVEWILRRRWGLR